MGTNEIDLNELQIFATVCERKSFTAAAKRLGAPKSSVSRAVQKLEKRLGVSLLERTTRAVQLTQAGDLYLQHCRRVVEEAEQADAAVAGLTAVPRGRLRLGVPGPFARSVLSPILADFVLAYPDVRLQLVLLEGESGDVRDKALDLAIRPGPLQDSELFVRPVLSIQLGVYASPAYLQTRERPETPAQLREHSCITTNCGTEGEPAETALWRLRKATELSDVQVNSRVSVVDPSIRYQLTVGGVGIAMLPQNVARNDVAEGRLVRLLPEWEPERIELHAVYSGRLSTSPKVRVFLQFLRERFDPRSFLEGDGSRSAMKPELLKRERTG